MITVAITTFNRAELVCRAIASALEFLAPIGGKVIVVDDGSPTPILPSVRAAFDAELRASTLVHVRQDRNGGVTSGKNLAFAHSEPGWVLFLDSDDEMLAKSAQDVARALSSRNNDALMFFRCVDQEGALVGHPFDTQQELSLVRYLTHTSYGEALVAINKAVAPMPPFDPDLRGYEGMGCARLIDRYGPALLMPIVARRYRRVGEDRLSTVRGMMARARYLCRGHLRYVSLFGSRMSLLTRITFRAKAGIYFVMAMLDGAVRVRNDRST